MELQAAMRESKSKDSNSILDLVIFSSFPNCPTSPSNANRFAGCSLYSKHHFDVCISFPSDRCFSVLWGELGRRYDFWNSTTFGETTRTWVDATHSIIDRVRLTLPVDGTM